MDGNALARFRRLQKAAVGKYIMALDSLSGLCHTQADGQFIGYDPLELPEFIREQRPADAEQFLHDCFRAERLALSVIAPL